MRAAVGELMPSLPKTMTPYPYESASYDLQAALASTKRGAPLSNSVGRSVMTINKLLRLILQGFGQGRDDDYKPWIAVTRGLSAPVSNIGVFHVPIQARPLHLLSRLEQGAGHVAAWIGAREAREQFPLFPWAWSHPLAGLHPARDCLLPAAPALLSIGEEARIDIGRFVGSERVPFVATTDLVLRFGEPPNDRLVFWSCKPRGILDDPKSGPQAERRIELERRYAAKVGAFHAVYDGTHANKTLVTQLDWLAPRHDEYRSEVERSLRRQFAEAFNRSDAGRTTEDLIACSAKQLDIDIKEAQRLFRACSWECSIDADLTCPIVMSRPLRRGGSRVKQQLKKQLTGAVQ